MKARPRSKGHPKFDTSEQLEEAIDDYFTNGVAKRTVIIGKAPNQTSIEIEVPTITGLCYYLGFESRQSFYDMEKREDLSYTIKRARLFIEQEYEEMLHSGNTIGAIFALKNFGWIDKQSVEMSGPAGGPIELTNLERAAKLASLRKLAETREEKASKKE